MEIPGTVLLYSWPSGHKIVRVTGPAGVALYPDTGLPDYHRSAAESLLNDSVGAVFVLIPPSHAHERNVVIAFNHPEVTTTVPVWATGTVMDNQADFMPTWSTRYWVPFAEDMLLPPDVELVGHWGGLPLPWWLDGSVYEELETPETADAEKQLGNLESTIKRLDAAMASTDQPLDWGENPSGNRINAMRRRQQAVANKLVERVFAVYLDGGLNELGRIRVAPSDWLPPDTHRSKKATEIWIRPRYYFGFWTIDSAFSPDISGVSKDDSLKEALERTRFNRLNTGAFMDIRSRDQWYEEQTSEGTPTVAAEELEPYFLLGADSPLLWVHSKFMGWWEARSS